MDEYKKRKTKTDKALLVVSFGTTHRKAVEENIEPIENALAKAMPDRAQYRAWTSEFIIRKLKERDGTVVDNVKEAFDRMSRDGIRDVLIVPTHMIAGAEYDKLMRLVREAKWNGDRLAVSRPLLDTQEDLERIVRVISEELLSESDDKILVLMGHGSAKMSEANRVYKDLEGQFHAQGRDNAFVGTVEGEPALEDVIMRLQTYMRDIDPDKIEVLLAPLMIVAGDHALNDMAGEDPDSWRNRIGSALMQNTGQGEGRITPILRGLGSYAGVQGMFCEKATRAKEIKGTGKTAENMGKAAKRIRSLCVILGCVACMLAGSLAAGSSIYGEEVYGAEGYDRVAPSSETAKSINIGKYGMVPVYGRDVRDGTYDVLGESSSSFFHIEKARLIVEDKKMKAEMTLSSVSYKFVYMGTAEEAAKAELDEYIKPKDRDGRSTFVIPLEALDKTIDCAAYSKRKKQWYDRKLLFVASSLEEGALKIELPDYDRIEEALELYDQAKGTDTLKAAEKAKEKSAENEVDEGTISVDPVAIDKKDGEYSIQVHMTGGSGRASVTSPTWFIVKDGKAYARLMWSSTYYDYMIVGGRKYMNESTDGGNSTFTIPVTVMDSAMPVIADTTAMGHPVEIEYKLTFYEDTVADKSQIPQEAAIDVLIIALIIILVGGILNLIVKRRRKQ